MRMKDPGKATDVYRRATIVLCLCGAVAVFYLLNNKPSQKESSALIGSSLDEALDLPYSNVNYSHKKTANQDVDLSRNLYDFSDYEDVNADINWDREASLVTSETAADVESALDQVMNDIAQEDKTLVEDILAEVVVEEGQDVKSRSNNFDEIAIIDNDRMLVDESLELNVKNSEFFNVDDCDLSSFGVSLSCEENWKMLQANQDGRKLVLSESPEVSVSWSRWEKKYRFLGQVNSVMLQNLNLYEDGFRTERVTFSDYEAVLVKGFSRLTSAQVRDYYYLYEGELVRTSFQVNPRDEWDSGKFLIQDVKKSLVSLR